MLVLVRKEVNVSMINDGGQQNYLASLTKNRSNRQKIWGNLFCGWGF